LKLWVGPLGTILYGIVPWNRSLVAEALDYHGAGLWVVREIQSNGTFILPDRPCGEHEWTTDRQLDVATLQQFAEHLLRRLADAADLDDEVAGADLPLRLHAVVIHGHRAGGNLHDP